ncbi:type II secretion system protein GspD [Treponema zioleckii]|uniref:type II secretion system protein GspD n=1 Tax=Treponema zioleckii TaxID=331680 RepID=UPI00168A407F|nr:type II and III secretion system protein [Treponema zioleckii]
MNIKKFCYRAFALILLLGTFSGRIFAKEFEFVNRDIKDILYAISIYKEFPVCADDTVSGKSDFRMSGNDFDLAFNSFLRQSRLYVEKNADSWTVSKIHVQHKNESGKDLYSLDAFDVLPVQLFERSAIATGLCVTYESLPGMSVSIHTGFCTAEEIFRRITGLCAGFEIKKEPSGFFHVSRLSGQVLGSAGATGKADFVKNADGSWTCDVQNALLSYSIEKICEMNGSEFCFAFGNESRIFRSYFTAPSFEEALGTLCVQGGAECIFKDKIWYFSSLKNKNQLVSAGKKWQSINLRYTKSAVLQPLIAKRFPEIEVIFVGDEKIMFLSDEKKSVDFRNFVLEADSKKESYLVNLKYIRTKEFLEHLPPFVEKSQIVDSGRGDSFYFCGSGESYKYLLSRIDEFDKPVNRISYDLLIMQYQSTDGSRWTPNFRAERLEMGDRNGVTTQLGSVLDLNLDVVGAFGMKFAAELQAAITETRAQVFADTTLNGVSGSTISFQNTNTYRYRDNNLDPETGKPVYSGVTKEITSGLKLEITGVVTGDGMITSKITASVSRQGSDLSATTGNPPPSSEKVITTEVRAKSGEPVVLSGLVQNEDTETVSRTPLLSRIPLLGHLFKSNEKSKEKTELVIYLVPTSEKSFGEKENNSVSFEHLRNLYGEFVEKSENQDGEENGKSL